jgi:preprotein translocase subunit SecG
MIYIAGIFIVLLLANCALLIFLVLMQLPKKDAGAGLAFGGGAADALFGAGSGNVLTKLTKYGTITFFALSLVLGYTEEQLHRSNASEFMKGVEQQQTEANFAAPPSTVPPAGMVSTNPQVAAPQTNSFLSVPLPASTNSPAK